MVEKVFITGVTGFAGNQLARNLLKKGNYSLSGTYYSEGSLAVIEDIRSEINCIKADITDAKKIDQIIGAEKPDTIFHLAALSATGESFKNPLMTITNNVAMQVNLLEAVKNHELFQTKILVISSADVYGIVDMQDLPIDEDTKFCPTNPYAVSKLTQDFLGLQYMISHNLQVIRVRPFNHIGPGQSPDFVVSSFAKQIAEIEKSKREPILSVGNIETKRDFTDVRDMVEAYSLIIKDGVIGDVYNIGTGVAYKIADILNKLLAFSSAQIDVKIDERLLRPSDSPELVCDNTKLHSVITWQPKYEIDETLKSILDYWRRIV